MELLLECGAAFTQPQFSAAAYSHARRWPATPINLGQVHKHSERLTMIVAVVVGGEWGKGWG